MCGIAGIVLTDQSSPVSAELPKKMADAVAHRGPDDSGVFTRGNVGFGFRRLSIIDLSPLGHQPMSNENETVWIVLNGEIYNFQELRKELEAAGYRFRSRTDTEVIIKAYEQFGDEFATRLRGMFAIALWDAPRKKLILVRDRLGKKPLHYFFDGSRFLFASEIKSLVQVPGVSQDLDWHSLEEFFTFGFISAPKTIYRSIRKVLPGHMVVLEGGSMREFPYWEIKPLQRPALPEEEVRKNLRAKICEAVKVRLTSDVPLGAFLSGGIDSSVIVAAMAEASLQRIKTFSIGFEEAEYDETKYARMVADRFSTDHTEEVVRSHYADMIESILLDFDEPFGDSSALPTYVVSKLTRKYVTVVLSGDGGDELFGGYDLHSIALRELAFDRVPSALRPLIRTLASVYPQYLRGGNTIHRMSLAGAQNRYIDRFKLMSDRERAALFSKSAKEHLAGYSSDKEKMKFFLKVENLDFLTQIQHNDVRHYLADDILVKVDRMSMLNSLEVRSPFLDHEVVEQAFSISPSLKIRNGTRKYILKEAFRDVLPAEILGRGKKGFAVPLKRWFADELHQFAGDVIFSEEMKISGLFDMDYAEKILRIHRSGSRDMSNQLWLLLAFATWARRFL